MLAHFIIAHKELKHLAIEKSSNKLVMTFYLILFNLRRVIIAVYNKIIFNLFGITYSGVSYSGGIFNVKNYFMVIKNIQDINEANEFIMNREKTFNIT